MSWDEDMLRDSDVGWQYQDGLGVGHHCGKQTYVSVYVCWGWGWGGVPYLHFCNRRQRKCDKQRDWLMTCLACSHSDDAKSDGPIAT